MRTRQSLSDLIRLGAPDGRAELVKLATRLIIGEAKMMTLIRHHLAGGHLSPRRSSVAPGRSQLLAWATASFCAAPLEILLRAAKYGG